MARKRLVMRTVRPDESRIPALTWEFSLERAKGIEPLTLPELVLV
jgi:hypothetical protein